MAPTMLRSPSPTGAPASGGVPEMAPNDSNLAAMKNHIRSLPTTEGPPLSHEQPPADSDDRRVLPPPMNLSFKKIPQPPSDSARTLAAAERGEISRRLRWSVGASLAFLALVCCQLARDAPHGEISRLKLLKVVISTSAYIFILLLLPFTHQIRKMELGQFVGFLLETSFVSVAIGLPFYFEDGWNLIMFNLMFVHLMALVNLGVVFINHLDLVITCLPVVLNMLLFVAYKYEKSGVAFKLIYVYSALYSEDWIKLLRDFEAKVKLPEFPEVVWLVRDVMAGVWGRLSNFFFGGWLVSGDHLCKGTLSIYEPLLSPHISRISSWAQQKGYGGQAPGEAAGFVVRRCDTI